MNYRNPNNYELCIMNYELTKGVIIIFSFLNRLFNRKSETVTKFQIVTDKGNGTFIYSGKVYQSDIVTACLAPYKKAVGKLSPLHIRKTKDKTEISPEPYMRFLLDEPNPLLTMQKTLEKIVSPLILSGNAFILIVRDENGYPLELFPIPAVSAEAIYMNAELYLKFVYQNGKTYTHRYDDIIHLRMNMNENDVFGEPVMQPLIKLVNLVDTIDTGMAKAIKNSNVIKWLIRFNSPLRSEDIKARAKAFSEDYLDVNNGQAGVVASDLKTDVQQVEPKNYVPNFPITESIRQRIYSLLGVNEKIVQGTFNEDEWNSFYENSIEPIALDLQSEFTRKLFTRKERAFGNKIIFSASTLSYASISTKLQFVSMVDRGAMVPNEWRDLFGYEPVEGGERPIRRLDTALVEGGETDES